MFGLFCTINCYFESRIRIRCTWHCMGTLFKIFFDIKKQPIYIYIDTYIYIYIYVYVYVCLYNYVLMCRSDVRHWRPSCYIHHDLIVAKRGAALARRARARAALLRWPAHRRSLAGGLSERLSGSLSGSLPPTIYEPTNLLGDLQTIKQLNN